MTTTPTEPINSQTPMDALHDDIRGVLDALTRQQDLLRIRGMSLDAGLLPLLRTLTHNLRQGGTSLLHDEIALNQLRALVDVAALVNSSLDLDTVLETAIDAVLTLTGAGRGYLLLADEGDSLHFHVARTRTGEEDDGADSVSRTLLRQVITSGQPLLTDNAALDPRMASSGTAARYTLRSVMCAPLIHKGHAVGAVYVDNRTRDGVFSPRELQLLSAITNQISVAMDNASLFASAQNSMREIVQATELVQNVFASLASGVITTDEHDIVRNCNAAAARILNIPLEAALGQPLSSLLPVVADEHAVSISRSRRDRRSNVVEVETEIAGRGRVVLTLTISPLQAEGEATAGIVVVIDDQTEKREREQSLELLRRYLPPGMLDSIQSIAQLGIEGERRDITCAFIDPGSLANFGSLDASEMMDRLNRYLEVLTAITHGARGIVDKYMGGEAMTLFNTQLNPQEDHASSALIAALLIAEQFAALDREYGFTAPAYRFGIHSGVATLGNVGGIQRRSFTAIGDNINLARRLQENAAAGQILISEETHRQVVQALGSSVRFIEGTALQVKGRTRPVRVYEVMRA